MQINYKGLRITACMHHSCAFGANYGHKIRKDQKSPTATIEELGAKTTCLEKKQGTAHAPCTQHHQRGGQNTSAIPPNKLLDQP